MLTYGSEAWTVCT